MDNRKTLRITIPSELVNDFNFAKWRAEDVAMVRMSDTQYASRLIQWALGISGKSLAVFDDDSVYNINGDSPKSNARMAKALMLLEESDP